MQLTVAETAVSATLPVQSKFIKAALEILQPIPAAKRGKQWGCYGLTDEGTWVDLSSLFGLVAIADVEGKYGGSVLSQGVGVPYPTRLTLDVGGGLAVYSTTDNYGQLYLGAIQQRRPCDVVTPISLENRSAVVKAIADPEQCLVWNAPRGYFNVVEGAIAETPEEAGKREGSEETRIKTIETKRGWQLVFEGNPNNANTFTRVYSVAIHLPYGCFHQNDKGYLVPRLEMMTNDYADQIAEDIKGVVLRPWYQWTTSKESKLDCYMTAGAFFAYMSTLRAEDKLEAYSVL